MMSLAAADGKLYELQSHTPERGSYFLDDYLEKNNEFIFASVVDPVMLALPAIHEAMGLDGEAKDMANIPLDLEKKPILAAAYERLHPYVAPRADQICEVFNLGGDELFHQLSREKLKDFLLAKFQRLYDHFKGAIQAQLASDSASPMSADRMSDKYKAAVKKRHTIEAASILCDLLPRWACEMILPDLEIKFEELFAVQRRSGPTSSAKRKALATPASKRGKKTPSGKRGAALSPNQSLMDSFFSPGR